jgi:hypothetical protein
MDQSDFTIRASKRILTAETRDAEKKPRPTTKPESAEGAEDAEA